MDLGLVPDVGPDGHAAKLSGQGLRLFLAVQVADGHPAALGGEGTGGGGPDAPAAAGDEDGLHSLAPPNSDRVSPLLRSAVHWMDQEEAKRRS